jgi:hypothetical protein
VIHTGTARTRIEAQVSPSGATAVIVYRDERVILELTVAPEGEVNAPSTTVTIAKHPGNLIIEG